MLKFGYQEKEIVYNFTECLWTRIYRKSANEFIRFLPQNFILICMYLCLRRNEDVDEVSQNSKDVSRDPDKILKFLCKRIRVWAMRC